MQQIENITKCKIPESTSPFVSIIIPVYNVEEHLRSCLISTVFQTLPETEIIVVNDASPDNSQQIIDEFVALYPEKVRCIVHEQNQGLAYARRTGLRNAHAPFVIFVDSDDFISGDLCAIMYEKMLSEDLDLGYFPLLRCWEGSTKRELLAPPVKNDQVTMIKSGLAAFCGAMYRKEFLQKYEERAFVPILYEDAATTPTLLSLTTKIGVYRKKALYFYRFGREGSICAQQITPKKMRDTFAADMINLSYVSDAQQDAYASRVLKRASGTAWKEAAIYDYSVEHVKKVVQLVEGRNTDVPAGSQRVIDQILRQPDEIRIPKIVYVNGFMRDALKSFDRYLEQARRAYLFDPELVVLDETSCDLSQLPAWLKDASNEEKGLYFAMRGIRERGGIYVSPAVQVVTSFNREAFRGAFFVAGPDTTVLPCAFGAEPDSPLLTNMLELLDREKTDWTRSCVADVMAHVLIGECGVHLKGSNEYSLYGLHMLDFGDVVRRGNTDRSYCILNYSNYVGAMDDMLCLPEHLNNFAWQLAEDQLAQLQEEKKALEKARKDIEQQLAKEKKLSAAEKTKALKAKKEFDKFRKSKLYRIARKLYNLLPKGLRKLFWK